MSDTFNAPVTVDAEPLPTLIVTADALDRFAKFNPAARDLMREFESAKFLWQGLRELCDDEETRQDTFDGETKLDSLIRKLMVEIIELQTVAPGIDAMIAQHRARKDRADKGIELRKELIQAAMIMANWVGKEKSLKLDIGNVNTRPATPTVDYQDEAAIPAKWFKRADPTLDRSGLKKIVLDRYKAFQAALAIDDQTQREQAIAKVQEDFGDEIPGVQVKVDGHTTTIKFS